MSDLFAKLKAEFPRDKIHWRAQSVTKDGKKAMALAYIDARDVMDRLDETCGPDGWQCEHFPAGGDKLGCKIGVLCESKVVAGTNVTIWKSDGAGETQVEGEKGAFSGAFKRAAVMWGIGRYLYDMPAPWVACRSENGKFREFTEDPWKHVKQAPAIMPMTQTEMKKQLHVFADNLHGLVTEAELDTLIQSYDKPLRMCEEFFPAWYDRENEEQPGLKQRIRDKRDYFEMARTNPLGAG